MPISPDTAPALEAASTGVQPVQRRRARQSGRIVEVWRAADLGVEDEGGDWVTVCVDHSTDCHHFTRALAISWAAEPLTWCEECQEDHR